MGYKNLIQTATTEMDDILLRELNELCPIDKQPILVHRVQCVHDTLNICQACNAKWYEIQETRPKTST